MGDAGQAEMLTKAYKLLAKKAAFKLRGIYWYTWRDQPGATRSAPGAAAPGNVDGTPKPAWDAFTRSRLG